jgi:hypothetical protein
VPIVYPLFAPDPVRRTTLRRRWSIQIPEDWAEHFRGDPPGVIRRANDCLGWNVYRSIASSSFHIDPPTHPKGFIELTAAGILTVPGILRLASIAPGDPLLMIGRGMWFSIHPKHVFGQIQRGT